MPLLNQTHAPLVRRKFNGISVVHAPVKTRLTHPSVAPENSNNRCQYYEKASLHHPSIALGVISSRKHAPNMEEPPSERNPLASVTESKLQGTANMRSQFHLAHHSQSGSPAHWPRLRQISAGRSRDSSSLHFQTLSIASWSESPVSQLDHGAHSRLPGIDRGPLKPYLRNGSAVS
jgi:hypothetical protein